MENSSVGSELSYLQTNFYEVQFIVVFGSIVLLFLIESFIPRRITEKKQGNRWISNISLTVFNHFFIIFYSIFLISIVKKFQPNSPLLEYFKVSDIPAFFVILFVMGFISYWIHRAFHQIPILWRIHAVHHTDTEVDVTTGRRHHPFEPMISTLILTPIVFALGAPAIVIIIYNLMHTLADTFSHSNIVLPKKLDNILRLIIITPDFHRMHHSSNQKYTDSNYSTLLSIYDYLFGTATRLPYDEIPEMELGLKTLREDKDGRLDKLLLIPFTYKSNNS